MTSVLKVLIFCSLSIFFLLEVDGRRHRIQRRSDDYEDMEEFKIEPENGRRGIIGNLINGLRPGGSAQIFTQQNQIPNVIPPSNIFQSPISPTYQLPTNVLPSQTQINRPIRPGLFGLLPGIRGSREQTLDLSFVNSGYNKAWVDYALQKCARVDTSKLTVVLPTSSNGLTEPKMYYFVNDTTVPWYKAQEDCTSKGMKLVTVNNAAENKVLQNILAGILANTPPGTEPAGYWIGLTNANSAYAPTWVGDGTSSYLDWHTGQPVANQIYCASYNSLTTSTNIHFDTDECFTASNKRYICEVSDECTALLMSRYPTPRPQINHSNSRGK